MSDFPPGVTDNLGHRPWPLPDGPWIMTQSWHDLLFAHWPVDARALQEALPAGLPLDTFEGQAWLAIVPFHMTNVAPRGMPWMPIGSAFPELNVRTYVTMYGKPGVYFFSLDAGNKMAVAAARRFFNLPYYDAKMTVSVDGQTVSYSSQRDTRIPVAEFKATYRPIGSAVQPQPGTLEHFLTERYCLYTIDDSFKAKRLEIHHAPWQLQAAEARIEVNTMADAAGIRLPSTAPLLHFARRQDVVAWAPYQVSSGEQSR